MKKGEVIRQQMLDNEDSQNLPNDSSSDPKIDIEEEVNDPVKHILNTNEISNSENDVDVDDESVQ